MPEPSERGDRGASAGGGGAADADAGRIGVAGRLDALLPTAFALALALMVFELLALFYDQEPAVVLHLLWMGTWGSGYGLGQVLFKATPLILTGLAVALPFRGGLFNIGAEGQAVVGALATGLLGAALPADFPAIPAVSLCLVAGFGAGALWGGFPGWLKARFGAHEVITTIMFNFIAMGFASWIVINGFLVPETLHTAPIVESARLSRLADFIPAFKGASVNTSLVLACVLVVAMHGLLTRTRFGFEIRAMGYALSAAEAGGVDVGRQRVLLMALAGGLAGLVGANAVLGHKYYYEDGFSGGVGFMGIAVALLGRNHPGGVFLAALLFGTLSQGGLAINATVPRDSMQIVQAVVILAVAAAVGSRRRPS